VTHERTLRAGLVFFGGYALLTGAWAFLAPGSFYDDFARYGAENHHYLGDAGSFSAAFGAMLLLALSRPAWRAPLLLLGAGWYGLHALNHFLDIEEARSTARGTADAVLLLIGAVAHGGLGALATRDRAR
jgi:hypothetical protein